ncbi:hypothetical protein ACFYY5_29590 [Nocardia elegans]|uniref:Uncharacterized protein n=1 Tax=Nocardia elegans TaxID=300029 RepID=A0ABW6TP80_9NOCA
MGVDLLDFFRGRRPWQQLYRFLKRLPQHGWYQAAIAMDEEIGWERAQQPQPDGAVEPPTPHGYTLTHYLLLRSIDLQKELLRILPAVFGGKLGPPLPPEPRPQTAEQRIRHKREQIETYDAIRALGVKV